jgi:tetratricopeptide (TPR) repeat protein
MPEGTIKVYDEAGRLLEITKSEWSGNVLPGLLEDAWDDADDLYATVIMALHDDLASEVAGAARRLFEIDEIRERSAVTLAITLMKTQSVHEAEKVLRGYIDEFGATGTVLTNLAKAHSLRGEEAAALKTLRQGLSLDPNQEDGLLWYAAIKREGDGEQGYVEALEDVAREPGAWRPQLWLARHHLESEQRDRALRIYRDVMSIASENGDALMMISGDLGNHGMIEPMMNLVLPVFDLVKHGPFTGCNLLRAMADTRRLEEGKRLMAELQQLGRKDLLGFLDEMESAFARMTPARPAEGPLEISSVWIDTPIWSRGLDNPRWMFPIKSETAPLIAFVAFSDGTRRAKKARQELEQTSGRLTRSLPLLLMESVYYGTDARPLAVFPVAKQMGPVVFGQDWTIDGLRNVCGETAPDIIVSGRLSQGVMGRRVEVTVWDAHAGTKLGGFKIKAAAEFAGVGGAIRDQTLQTLRELNICHGEADSDLYAPPPSEWMDLYLVGLGQLLTQRLCAEGVGDPDKLWNERGILETYFELCEGFSPTPQMLAIGGVLTAKAYGSALVDQYEDRLVRLLEGIDDYHSPAWRMLPLVYQRLGRESKANDWLRKHATRIVDRRYHAWISDIRH